MSPGSRSPPSCTARPAEGNEGEPPTGGQGHRWGNPARQFVWKLSNLSQGELSPLGVPACTGPATGWDESPDVLSVCRSKGIRVGRWHALESRCPAPCHARDFTCVCLCAWLARACLCLVPCVARRACARGRGVAVRVARFVRGVCPALGACACLVCCPRVQGAECVRQRRSDMQTRCS